MNKKITIMVVEDEPLLANAICKKLSTLGVETITCVDGKQALSYLSDGVIPDAIWLDYYLQGMNGLEFVVELKNNPDWSDIPVIVVSNSASPDKVDSMLALGVNKYLLKAQYRLDEIINIINEFIPTTK